MKHKKKVKTAKLASTSLPIGMQHTREIPSSEAKWKTNSDTFTKMEVGQPDGKLDEGSGDRQTAEIEELEQIQPKTTVNKELDF